MTISREITRVIFSPKITSIWLQWMRAFPPIECLIVEEFLCLKFDSYSRTGCNYGLNEADGTDKDVSVCESLCFFGWVIELTDFGRNYVPLFDDMPL